MLVLSKTCCAGPWAISYYSTHAQGQGWDKAGTSRDDKKKNSRGKQGQLGPVRDRLSLLVIYWHCLSLLGIFFVPAYPNHDPALGMGKGPKRTLELVNYRLQSRPLTDPRSRSLCLD